eukprot:s4353_g3.t1
MPAFQKGQGLDFSPTEALLNQVQRGGRQNIATSYNLPEWRLGALAPSAAAPAAAGPAGGPGRYYVHDESATVESPALPGMAGQLYICGKGVALGYIGAPELTKERFFHSTLAEQMTYKTGDLVRFMPEDPWGELDSLDSLDSDLRGTSLVLEFLGRADFQVKVRGHRIELQEIEEAARRVQLPHSVQAVVVMVVNQKLVAFVTPELVDVLQLAESLRKVLPKYMVPDLIFLRDQLPLTASGKVDRKALEGSVDLKRSGREIREPQSEMEKIVHDAYKKALGLEKLSVDDDFFELGGQSLAAMRLQSLLRNGDLQITLPEIFELRTAARTEIAERLSCHSAATAVLGTSLREEDCANDSSEALASFEQQRFWVMEQMGASTTYSIPFAYRLSGQLHLERLTTALRALLQRHDALRTVLSEEGTGHGYWRWGGELRQRILAVEMLVCSCKGLQVPSIWIHDFRHLDEGAGEAQKARAELLSKDMAQPFDLSKSPLRVHLIQESTSDGEQTLLLRDLWALYSAQELPALKLRYRDFSQWQRSRTLENSSRTAQHWQA